MNFSVFICLRNHVMKRLSFIAMLLAAPALAFAGALAGQASTPAVAKSACGCTECKCPNCNGEFCTCDKCECVGCGCAKAEAKPAAKSCCSVQA